MTDTTRDGHSPSSCRRSRWSAASSRAPGPTSAPACRPGSPPSTPRTWTPTSRGCSPTRCGRWPGISTYDDLGSPYKLNISSRGFYSSPGGRVCRRASRYSSTACRMNEPEASQINFDLLPMDHIQRIEVLLAATARCSGRNALGGAINLVTARGAGRPAANVELSGGSFGVVPGGGERLRPDRRRARLVRGRQLQPRGRLAGGDRRRAVQRLRQPGQAGRDQRHPVPGAVRQLLRGDGGLAAGDHLRDQPRLQPERERLRGPLGLPGLAPGLQAGGQRQGVGDGLLPPAPRRAVQRQPAGRSRRLRHLLQHHLRLHRGLPLGHAARTTTSRSICAAGWTAA